MALCKKCMTELMGNYPGLSRQEKLDLHPYLHCHHEELEEKPTICWCEVRERNQKKIWDGYEYLKLNFCPECGRKLNG